MGRDDVDHGTVSEAVLGGLVADPEMVTRGCVAVSGYTPPAVLAERTRDPEDLVRSYARDNPKCPS